MVENIWALTGYKEGHEFVYWHHKDGKKMTVGDAATLGSLFEAFRALPEFEKLKLVKCRKK